MNNINIVGLSESLLETLLEQSWFADAYYEMFDDDDTEFIETSNETIAKFIAEDDLIEEIIEMECLNDSSFAAREN